MTALLPEAVQRQARKPWRCVAADEIRSWRVRMHSDTGWAQTTYRTQSEAEAHAARKIGQPAGINADTGEVTRRYTHSEVTPNLNPEWPGRSPDCRETIQPGDPYIEYLGEAMAWESGTRYCQPCGEKVWSQ